LSTNITYRPEIDGLRALAVISVITYHLKFYFNDFTILQGGFLGVDIFFVISGYLITSLIKKEILSRDKISYLNFLDRRIRRIIPLIIFVFLVFLPIAYIFLLPQNLMDFSKSILYSLGFSSNVYFYLTEVEYGLENLSKPILHLWSLSIEQQYYIIFPIIFFLIFKFFKQRIILFFLILVFLNLFLMQFLGNLKVSPPFVEENFSLEAKTVFFNFYFLSSRLWEFFAGTLVSLMEEKKNEANGNLNSVLCNFGFGLIIFSMFFYNDRDFHPSFINFFPVFGTCLIIFFYKEVGNLSFLSSKIFVGIGKISYSLYLWHFPIISFLFFLNLGLANNLVKFYVILLTVLLSIFTFNFIEKPFRQRKVISSKSFYSLITFFSLILIVFCTRIIVTNGAHERVPEILSKKNQSKVEFYNHRVYEHKKESRSVILVGDSQLRAIKFDLKKRLKNSNLNYAQSIFDGCQLIINTQRVDKVSLATKLDCDIKTQEIRMDFLKNHTNSIVVLGGRLPLILSEERFNNEEGGYEGKMNDFIQNYDSSIETLEQRNALIEQEYKNTVMKILKLNNFVILIYPIPEVGWNLPRKLMNLIDKNLFKLNKNKFDEELEKNPITTSYDIYKKRSDKSFKLLNEIQHPKIIRIYPHKIFCNNKIHNRCVTHSQTDMYYYDNNHLSIKGAELLNDIIMQEIKKIVEND